MLLASLAAAGCGGDSSISLSAPSTPTSGPAATATATVPAPPTATATRPPPAPATATTTSAPPTRTATATQPPTRTATASPAPTTALPTASATAPPSTTPTVAASATVSATATAPPTVTATAPPTATATGVPTATNTSAPSATVTATGLPTGTAAATATATATPPPTLTFTPTATPTSGSGAVCGNRVLEAGETCTACPADCVVGPCSNPGMPTQAFTVDLVPPLGFQPTTATILLGYDSTVLSLPGMGTATTVRQRVVAPPPVPQAFTPNDLDYAVRVLVSRNVPLGTLFTATFDRCGGAPAPLLGDVACQVESCAAGGSGVPGCTCTVRLP